MRKKTTLATLLLILLAFAVSTNLTPVMHAVVATEWNVVLTATKEGYRDDSEFGVRNDATEGFDTAYDALDPPDPPTGVVSYFWYPDNPTTPVNLQKLSKSKIAPSQYMNWTYEVKPVNIDGLLLVNWTTEDIASIPSEYSVHLLNSAEQVVADMREVTEYSFTAESGITYTFTIKVRAIRELVIDVVGSGTTNPPPGPHWYNYGDPAVVDAIPDTGWVLDHWLLDGVDVGDADSYTVTMDDDYSLTAVFMEGWDVVLTATKEGYSDLSEFGVRNDATDGFDAAYDELDPPEPPTGVVSYFWYPDNPTTPTDQRKLSVSKIAPSPPVSWTYNVTPVNIDGSMRINWSAGDISTIPSECGVYLECPDESVIDMRQVTEYWFTAESGITYGFTICVGGCYFDLQLSAGWNMVSFPCIPRDDPSFSNILSDVGFYQVLTWDGISYVTPENVECGRGYWILVLEETTIEIKCGIPCSKYELDLPPGWSMIGSIITCTVDPDCVFPGFYQLLTWDGAGYIPSTTIEPGKGYWALVLEPTHIIVDESCCITG